MNVINVDYKKIKSLINGWILQNNAYYCSDKDTVITTCPIILMSDKTLRLFHATSIIDPHALEKNRDNYSTFFGCKIAIANWLPLGEVELR